MYKLTLLLALVATTSAYADSFEPGDVLTIVWGENSARIENKGKPLAALKKSGDTLRLESDQTFIAEISREIEGSSYPRRITMRAKVGNNKVAQTYVEVAPPVSIEKEAGANGLTPYSEAFRKLTGRELKNWYEISGRWTDGEMRIDGDKVAGFYTGYQRNKNGSYKEHHRGDTLEHADVITYGPNRAFVSYRCGCHGFTEYCPKIALAGYGYRVEVKSNGEWVNIGKGALFRKPLRYILIDERDNRFATIDIRYTGDTMDRADYRFQIDGKEIARATVEGPDTRLELNAKVNGAAAALDTLLAMLPTQVLRGDGVRDSRLGQIEALSDWARLIAEPSAEHLADAMSKIDAASAPRKVLKFLSSTEDRFKSKRNPDEAPPGVLCTPNGCSYLPEAR